MLFRSGGGREQLRAFLGTIPDYTTEVEGVKLSGVRAGGPAEKAGIKGGDIIVEFGGRYVLGWKPGDKAPSVVAKGPGGFDGVVVVGGRILVSSWADSSVSSYETGQQVKLISGIPGPADIGYDAKRNRLLIPSLPGNRVEIWQLP